MDEYIIDGTEKELVYLLIGRGDTEGIKKLTEDLYNKYLKIDSQTIQSLYENGYLKPRILIQYFDLFLDLLKSKNNRMVWGAMIALSMIAEYKAKEIFDKINLVCGAMKDGSNISIEYGLRVLVAVVASKPEYNAVIFPLLLDHLKVCKPKDLRRHGEIILQAVTEENKDAFFTVLKSRNDELGYSTLKPNRWM